MKTFFQTSGPHFSFIYETMSTSSEHAVQVVRSELIGSLFGKLDKQPVDIFRWVCWKIRTHLTIPLMLNQFTEWNNLMKQHQKCCLQNIKLLNDQQQYDRSSSLRFLNMPLHNDQSTDTKIVDIWRAHFEINISENYIERSHNLCNYSPGKSDILQI